MEINQKKPIDLGSMAQIARTIIDAQYQIAHDRVVAEVQIEQLELLTTEDELLSAAVNLTKRQ